jgi:hypothetical protein
MVKCTSCDGTGKVTLRQKSEHRDGKADWLNPVPGEFWTVTMYRDGSVAESVRRK